jgi:hypothetical protein
MVDVVVTAFNSWKGAIRVEAMAQGEAPRRDPRRGGVEPEGAASRGRPLPLGRSQPP